MLFRLTFLIGALENGGCIKPPLVLVAVSFVVEKLCGSLKQSGGLSLTVPSSVDVSVRCSFLFYDVFFTGQAFHGTERLVKIASVSYSCCAFGSCVLMTISVPAFAVF